MEAAKTCCGNLGRVQLPKPLVPGEISLAVLQFVLQLCCSSSARNTAVGNLGSAGRETGSKPGSEERTKRTLWRRWRTWRLLCNLLLELCMCSGDVVCILSVRLGICSKPFSEERTKPFVCC